MFLLLNDTRPIKINCKVYCKAKPATKRFPSSIGHAACLNHSSDGTRKCIRSIRTISFPREFRDTRCIAGAMQIRKVRRRCNDILAINRRLAHRAEDKLLSDGETGSAARPGNSVATSLHSAAQCNYITRTKERACRLRDSEASPATSCSRYRRSPVISSTCLDLVQSRRIQRQLSRFTNVVVSINSLTEMKCISTIRLYAVNIWFFNNV